MINTKWTRPLSVLLCLSLAACQSTEPPKTPAPKEQFKFGKDVKDVTGKKINPVLPKTLAKEIEKFGAKRANVIEAVSPLQVLNRNASKLTLPGRKLSETKVPELTYRLADYMKSIAKDKSSFDQKAKNMTLNEENTPLINVISSFQEILDFQFIIDPAVRGTILAKISLPENYTVYDTWAFFEQILWMGGAYATVEPGGIIRIMPFTKMSQEHDILIKGNPKSNVNIHYLQIRNTLAAEVLNSIRPFLTPAASATLVTRDNAIMVVETPANSEKILSLVRVLDNKGQAAWPQFAYQCKYSESATLVTELQAAVPALGYTIAQGSNTGNGVNIASIDRMNVLVVSAPTQTVLDEITKWIKILDSGESNLQEQVYYYPVKHGVSEDLVTALNIFFPNTSSASTPQSNNNSTGNRAGGTTNRTPSRTSTTNRNTAKSTQAAESIFEEEVTIFEDKRRNQLIIRTSARAYGMMEALLNHLDAPAMQAMLQVTVVEVELNDNLEYGFEYAAQQKFGTTEGSAGIGNSVIGPATLAGAGDISPGLSLLLAAAGVDNEFAFAQAVAGNTNTRLLNKPEVLAINGEEATLSFGQQVPIRNGTTTSSSGGTTDNIEYRNTGIIMNVTPQISADKRIILKIELEISSISDSTVGGIDSPIINENKATTTLMLNNRETILLGGIITKSRRNTNSGIPFLKDIPYLGILFGGTTINQGDKELVLFVKGSVLDTKSDHQKEMERYKEALKYTKTFPELD